jgi:preprotein translocase subunit SecY
MSILIFTSVISTLPFEGRVILEQGGTGKFITIMLIGLAIVVAVIYVDQGQRRVPVQYAKRVVGRKMTSGGSTYLPLKVNQAGVIPIIFATSVLYFPALLASVYHAAWFQTFVQDHLQNQRSIVYMALLAMLIIFFSYFYTAIQFDPTRTADNLRKNGGFIPGIRPGPPTADYLNRILIRIGLPGAIFLAVIALIPTIVFAFWDLAQFPFGGTSILIAVGVALETMKQIESQLLMRHYEGFLG